MFESRLMTNALLVVLIMVAAGILTSIVALGVAVIRAKKPTPTAWEWLKDLLIPLITPVVVVALGFWFAIQSDRRQRAESERQRQASVMKDLIVSQDRANTSSFLAVGTQLSNHLQRYVSGNKLHKNTDFDEEAIFFFYGMHRAALVNLHATEGNLVFPRVWMEEAFENMASHVVEAILGTTELDPALPADGEAVLYAYFGARSDSSRTATEQAKHSEAGPLLFSFHCLLHDTTKASDPIIALEGELLRNQFHDFQERLHNQKIKPSEVMDTLFAMDALDVYAYNNAFADWYGTQAEKIPQDPPSDPPRLFLPSASQEVRKSTWDLIRRFAR